MGCGASADPPKKKNFAFRVRVIGGLNLYNNGFGARIPGTVTSATKFQGKSDPYVRIQHSSQVLRTKTIKNEQNPTWNEELYFTSDDRAPRLDIKVLDAEIGNDEIIGRAQLNCHGLIPRDHEREVWIPLEGAKANGEIGLALVECYRTTVTLIKGVELKPMNSISSTSDCYVVCSLGQQPTQRTNAASWTNNPTWGQKFDFLVPYGIRSQLSFTLFDAELVGIDANMGWFYTTLEGKPNLTPEKDAEGGLKAIVVDVCGAKGKLHYTMQDDTTCDAAPAKEPTEEQKARFPSRYPMTCSFEARVLGAYNLAAADGVGDVNDFINEAKMAEYKSFRTNQGTSDPFARLICEGQVYETRHINNTLEPIWNERFRLVSRDRYGSKLQIMLFDHDTVSDDCIGHVHFALDQLKPGQRLEVWSLLDKGRGEVGVELSQDVQLKVRIVSCDGLPAKDFNGLCDPYVKMRIGDHMHQTRVVHNSRTPWFEEDFRFFIPTLEHTKLQMGVWDHDLAIPLLNKGATLEDHMGDAEIDLERLIPGQINRFELELTSADRKMRTGRIVVEVTNEVPLLPTDVEKLEKQGREAFNAAVTALSRKADFIRVIADPDYGKKKEMEVETAEPKLAPRPRFSRIQVDIVGLRDIPSSMLGGGPLYVAMQYPTQGFRYKTALKKEKADIDYNESMELGCPSRDHGRLEFFLCENDKHQYAAKWPKTYSARASINFKDLNGGEGLIRGAPANDTWLNFDNGGKIGIRVSELFRFNIKILGAHNVKAKSDPFIMVRFNGKQGTTSMVSNDPKADRTEGIRGEPLWNEHFTFYSKTKKDLPVEFRLMDKTMVDSEKMIASGIIPSLADLHRGIPVHGTLTLREANRGEASQRRFHEGEEGAPKAMTLDYVLVEEEKMALIDQVIDAASTAAKLAVGTLGDVAGNAKNVVTGALGAFF